MISFDKFVLSNGLEVIVHPDHSSPTVCLNLLYKVGSRNEDPGKTGFAHFFEHLMFGGSQNIKAFDEVLQSVGGDNNAFTSTDITNYYTTVPAMNVETAFWLESDRMLSLSFEPRVLETQRSVVIEEYKQRYLNQPYGDVWHKLRPAAYTQHPYRWPTIGKDISHVEEATMEDVRSFFDTYYGPENAILVIAGQITLKRAQQLAEKWFGPVPSKKLTGKKITPEPKQIDSRNIHTSASVPQNAIYQTYHMQGRSAAGFHAGDLISDLLGRGDSSWLHQKLVKEQKLFSAIGAGTTGSIDPGLLTISGRLNPDCSFEQGEKGIRDTLGLFDSNFSQDLEKAKNMAESTLVFGEIDLLNRAMGLAFTTFMGETDRINTEIDEIRSVTVEEMQSTAREILRETNCTTLYYEKA